MKTNSPFPELPFPTDYQQELAMAEQHIRDLQGQIYEQATPFEETADFRDFVVWLCGFTDRSAPPSQKDWDGLCDRTKQVATKFALKVRADDLEKLRRTSQYSMKQPYTSSGYVHTSSASAVYPTLTNSIGISGDQVLQGYEDAIGRF